jgi:hypothetical protein
MIRRIQFLGRRYVSVGTFRLIALPAGMSAIGGIFGLVSNAAGCRKLGYERTSGEEQSLC